MPIDRHESRIYNGRDIFGFPKKKADIHVEKDGKNARGWVERHGQRFVEVSVEHPVEKYARDAKLLKIIDGANEILMTKAARLL
jgi:alkylation response protein AidB-like acyl-CoA dehydrogenase